MILVESLASSCNEYLELFMKNWTRKEQSLRFREVEFLQVEGTSTGTGDSQRTWITSTGTGVSQRTWITSGSRILTSGIGITQD